MKLVLEFVWLGVKILLGFFLFASCGVCMFIFMLTIRVAQVTPPSNIPANLKGEYTHRDIAELLYKDDVAQLRQAGGLHGLDGFKGYDFNTECGDILYSPLPGLGVVTYNALDGYVGPHALDRNGDGAKDENTMITIKGDAGTVTMFHGKYTKVRPGDEVIGGVTPIGYNASEGNSTGCHTHLIWNPNPDWNPKVYNQKGNPPGDSGYRGNYGSVLTDYEDVGIRVSHYIPSQGGVNCDSDCSTMASGDKVAAWTLGQNGEYAIACPQEFPFRTKIMIENRVYVCVDRGGWINAYAPGDYDPAMKSNATEKYFWVDILGETGFSYGEMTHNWKFVE